MTEAMGALGQLDQLLHEMRQEQRVTNLLLAMILAGRNVSIPSNGTLDDRAALAYLAQAEEIARGGDGKT